MVESDELNEMFMMSNGVPIHPDKRVKNRFILGVKAGNYDEGTLNEVKSVIENQLKKMYLDRIKQRR